MEPRYRIAVSATASVLFIVYVFVAGLTTIGRHLLVIGIFRFLLLPAFRIATDLAQGRAPARVGWWLGVAGALLTFAGGLGVMVGYGPNFDPLAGDSPAGWPPYAIGAGAALFMLGTILCGVALLRAGHRAVGAVALLAGLSFVGAGVADPALGHVIWAAAWLLFCAMLWRNESTKGSVPSARTLEA